jgi:hypothetical protein
MLISKKLNINSNISIAFFLILFISFGVLLSVPLWDIDLWWHLQTGKFNFENKKISGSDPFSFASDINVTRWTSPVLKNYWLSQVIFYLAFKLFGYHGIIMLRVLIFISIYTVIIFYCKKKKILPVLVVVLISLAGWTSLYFTAARPQLFTFLFVVIILNMFDDIGYSTKDLNSHTYNLKRALIIPPFMCLWANLHPGFILGSVLIMIYVLAESIKFYVLQYATDKRSFYFLLIIMSAGLLATLFNPNIYKQYVYFAGFMTHDITRRTTEYLSPIKLLRDRQLVIYPYWIYMIGVFLFIIRFLRNMNIYHILIVGFLLSISLYAYRYIPYFIFCSSFIIAGYISVELKKRNAFQRAVNLISWLIVVVVVIFSYRGYGNAMGAALKEPVNKLRFPLQAATFMDENKPVGRMFNHFNWGGYLMWRLYPDHKVFIDGRYINLEAFSDYTYILWDNRIGKNKLEKYEMNIVIMPALNYYSGELYGLINYLHDSGEWHLIYADNTAVIFIERKNNEDLVNKYSIPKDVVYYHVINQAKQFLSKGKNNYYVWNALYVAYEKIGMNSDAERAKRIAESFR